jgi:hypothetical protein
VGRLSTRPSSSAWVDPVEVLDDEKDRLHSRFCQQHPLDRVEGTLAALHGIGRLPGGVVHRNVEERKQCGQVRLECAVQGQDLPRDPLSYTTGVIAVLDAEVGLEQVDDRQIRRRLPVRDGPALDDQPAARAVGVRELVKQS